MITEVVHFTLSAGMTREDVLGNYRQTARPDRHTLCHRID